MLDIFVLADTLVNEGANSGVGLDSFSPSGDVAAAHRSGLGRKSNAAAGTGTPWLRSCWARVITAAPSMRLRAIWTTPRFWSGSRNEPATQALNAPIAGPHQIW